MKGAQLCTQMPEAIFNKKGLTSLADTTGALTMDSKVSTENFLNSICVGNIMIYVNQGYKITSQIQKTHDKTSVF